MSSPLSNAITLLAASFVLAACTDKNVSLPLAKSKASTSQEVASAASALQSAVAPSKKDMIHIGVDEQFPPMVYRAANKHLIGFDVDMATEAFKRIAESKGIDFVAIDWQKKDEYLNKQKSIDLLWSGVNISPERQNVFDFSEPYLTNRQIVVVLADSPIKAIADLSGKKIAVQQGSALIPRLKEFKGNTGPIGDILIHREYALGMIDMINGKADATAMGEVVFKHFNASNPGKFRIIDGDFGVTEMAVAVRKGDTEMLTKINRALTAMKADGTIDRLVAKWSLGK